ncbi:MAG: methyltransferase domain-containing protein [Bacteroidota bacterium]
MALKQHTSITERFRQQYENAKDYLIPFVEERFAVNSDMKVLEIGAAEGGVLKAFIDKGCWTMGVDLSPFRIDTAKEVMAEEVAAGQIYLEAVNVYDDDFREKWGGQFDLIVLKDTIEHIPEQEKFIPYIKQFLKPEGVIFFGFPPWRMPYGGHQQICRTSKLLSKLPWFHLLPKGLYKRILIAGGEGERVVEELMDIKATGINLGRFERIVRKSGLRIRHRRLFLINPIYKYKFGLKVRTQLPLLGDIPFLRDFVTTCGWYLVERK